VRPPDLSIFATSYAVHITTRVQFDRISATGELRARSSLPPRPNLYADAALVSDRASIDVGNRGISDCIPFYLHPVQPMFARLVLNRKIALRDIVFIWIEVVAFGEFDARVFSTNPAYPGSMLTNLRELKSVYLDSGLSLPWYEARRDKALRNRLQLERQAEALILSSSVPVDRLRVTDALGDLAACATLAAFDAEARRQYLAAAHSRPFP